MQQDPLPEYSRRLGERRALSAQYERRHIAFGNVRLGIALAAVAIAWLAIVREALSPWWLAPAVAVFTAVAIVHARVVQAQQRADRAATFYERGLGRLQDRWAGQGEPGERFLDPTHPYAEDLDLFGKGSLYELLCTVRTRTGEETLARWLLHGAPPDVVGSRQKAIQELRLRLDLREDLSVLGEDMRSGINPKDLAEWSEEPPLLASRTLRVTGALLSMLAIVSASVWAAFGEPQFFLGVVLAEAVFGWRLRPRFQQVIRSIGRTAYGLELLSLVLVRFEAERFSSPKLVELRAALDTEDGSPPSRQIARLHRLLELLDSRDNVVVRVIGPPLLWSTQLAFAIEDWRARSGPAVRRWLSAVGEIEALCAFSGYAYEHPADPFPEFAAESPWLEGEGLGHPLLPEARCVRNDVRLGGDLRVYVVSGSNMSGKSTLLRTIGTNTVLAMAGAPVHAKRLRMSPLAVGASIRVTDSLQGGSSRFYAEITRLRRLLDLARGPQPLLFLLDELLHGTNSHDRRIGAAAVVRGLVEHGAIGLITTHDLALAHIAEVLAPRGANVHFEDHLENGRISFDYRLRPGVVRKSNALELMRSIGLEV
jgi:hypothetical protein